MSAPDDDVLQENNHINMNHDKSAVQSISADVIAIILITITAISIIIDGGIQIVTLVIV